MTSPELIAPIDRESLKVQVEAYKRFKQNGYIESAGKELDEIERKLEKIQAANPAEYDDVLAYLDL
ncbi:hypothetical protein W822_15515 [Advenella kashmirensis W13003]|uniref:Uncharacterized protein n=1 Tax=Advenella kashmirensis W13003 TaxID=1424334 RepID=V8QSV2_9BURK|nr:hypothetical protein [Advenella kashmirensis]ETF02415.1 hypothetical protein W822_15515 [Advenella kashmirensis W13003]